MTRVVAVFAVSLLGTAALAAPSIAAARQPAPAQSGAGSACTTHLTGLDAGKCPGQNRVALAWVTVEPVCPVAMFAKQRSDGGLLDADRTQQPQQGPMQNINLTLAPYRKGAEISQATVRVQGLTPRVRAVAADPFAIGPAEITRTLHLSFNQQDADGRAADLALRGFTSVSFIELVSLTYADGSTWKQGEQTCRVAPDPMMLIGAR